MKKLALLLILGLSFAFFSCEKDGTDDNDKPKDEFLAPTTPQKKNAVLEQFTGVRCPNCPDGSSIAKTLMDNNPGKVIVIATHSTSYATPQAGWANFTTPFGAALVTNSGLTGVPAGTVNRHKFTGSQYAVMNSGNALAMSRSGWTAAANTIMQEDAPVNIGAKSTFDAATRTLTVKVDLYYTAAETIQNYLNVALLQDGTVAKQSGGGDNYVHNNMLRHYITGQWGEQIPSDKTVKDGKYTKTFTYVVPDDYNGATIPPGGGVVDIDKCRVAVFVAREKVEVLNGIALKAK